MQNIATRFAKCPEGRLKFDNTKWKQNDNYAKNYGKQNYRVCFDLDGTLADTAPDIALALNKSLNEAGLSQLPLESVKGMIGNGIPVLVRRALCHVQAPEDLAANVITSMHAYAREYYCEKSSLMHLSLIHI